MISPQRPVWYTVHEPAHAEPIGPEPKETTAMPHPLFPRFSPCTWAWLIDEEYNDADEEHNGPATAVEIFGPSDAPDDLLAQLRTGEGVRFKLYDDDGILNLAGRILCADEQPAWDQDEEIAFAPLNDYGTPGWGSTEIRYPSGPNGKWETL